MSTDHRPAQPSPAPRSYVGDAIEIEALMARLGVWSKSEVEAQQLRAAMRAPR